MIQRMMGRIRQEAEQWKKEGPTWLLPAAILSLLYLVGLSALLRANVSYVDDAARAVSGYQGWDHFSRFLSCFLSVFVHMGQKLADISPVPQLFAVVIMALSGVVVLRVVSEEKKVSLWQYAAVLLLGLSPYFLECFSYKYDAPYMALSVLGGIFPLLLYRKGRVAYVLASIAGILVVCTTYQASTGIFPMLVVFLAAMQWHRGEHWKTIASFVGQSVLGYGVGMMVFRLFIMVPQDDYSSTGLPGIGQLIPNTLSHFKQYYKTVISDFRMEWLLLVLLLAVCFLYTQVWGSRRNKALALLVAVATLAVTLLLCFGVYPVLSAPSFNPRGMYGFGVWIAFLGAFVATYDRIYVGKLTCLVLSWAFVVFALAYGNALDAQQSYTEFRMEQTIDDLVDLHVLEGEQPKTVQIVGDIGYSPVVKNRPADENIMTRLVPITFGDSSWYWGRYVFSNYYGLRTYMKWDSSVDLTTMDLPVLTDNVYHTIRGNDQYILIELKK